MINFIQGKVETIKTSESPCWSPVRISHVCRTRILNFSLVKIGREIKIKLCILSCCLTCTKVNNSNDNNKQ